ncbi:TPA: hypothetical protein R1945_002426, partial [Staphylococcus delphini]|nr:hypothetical protein [Staphylococcus delphini]
MQLTVISLCLPISIDLSMTTLILLLMSSCFPILEAMSIYLQMLIDFSQLIATSLHLPTSIFAVMSTCLLTPIGFLLLIVISLYLPTSIGSSTRMLISPHLLI